MEYNGLVRKVTGKNYEVEDRISGQVYSSRLATKIPPQQYRLTNPVSVGDFVTCDFSTTDISAITAVAQPKNYFIRRATNLSKEAHILGCNIDQLLIIVTTQYPALNIEFLDRCLLIAQWQEILPLIIVNKSDISTDNSKAEAYCKYLLNVYPKIGYKVIQTSVIKGMGIDEVKNYLQNKTSMLIGNSGVGKSSLINTLSSSNLKVGAISSYHHTGKHTTTFSEMLRLEKNTYIIDTPGIKSLGIIGIENGQFQHYFPDLAKWSEKCKMRNCTHIHEVGCAVQKALESGEIEPQRFQSYLNMATMEYKKYR